MNQYYPLTISALHIFAFFLKRVLEFRAKCKNSVTGDVRTSLQMPTNCSTVSTVVLTSTESEIEFFRILLMGVIESV